MARFRAALGELWPVVEPLCVETSAEEIRQLAERLPVHLATHDVHGRAASALSAQLLALLEPWDVYQATQRSVARAAVAYFLETGDAVPDELVDGLAEDEVVVAAALDALTPGFHRPCRSY